MSDMTPNDFRLLQLMADGLTTDQIAQRMKLKNCAVERRRIRLYEKMEVKNGIQAIATAFRTKLIE